MNSSAENLPSLKPHWDKVLQALAYWVGYKQEYFYKNLLPEAAVVAELTQLLSSMIDSDSYVDCEKMYKSLGIGLAENIRADVVVFSKADNRPLEVIEVKRCESSADYKKIEEDFKKLALLKESQDCPRLLQVVVGQKRIDSKYFTKTNVLSRKDLSPEPEKYRVKARLAKKAFETKARTNSSNCRGIYAAIFEII